MLISLSSVNELHALGYCSHLLQLNKLLRNGLCALLRTVVSEAALAAWGRLGWRKWQHLCGDTMTEQRCEFQVCHP